MGKAVTDLKQKLEAAWKLYRSGNYRDPVFGELEVANYEPAKALFRAMLDHKKERFRTRALNHLQLMRDLSSDDELLEKVRDVVVNDPEELTRSAAALLLAAHSRWPDEGLKRALEKETDPQTKEGIFLSILQLMTSWDFADAKRSDVTGGDIALSMESATKLAERYRKSAD